MSSNLILSAIYECDTKGKYMEGKILKVTKTSWSGRSKDYKPIEKVSEHKITEGEKIELDRREWKSTNGSGVNVFEVTIAGIGENSITLETSKAMAVRRKEKLGISLNGNGTTFAVSDSEKLELVTPTMDYGYIYIFEILDK